MDALCTSHKERQFYPSISPTAGQELQGGIVWTWVILVPQHCPHQGLTLSKLHACWDRNLRPGFHRSTGTVQGQSQPLPEASTFNQSSRTRTEPATLSQDTACVWPHILPTPLPAQGGTQGVWDPSRSQEGSQPLCWPRPQRPLGPWSLAETSPIQMAGSGEVTSPQPQFEPGLLRLVVYPRLPPQLPPNN